jgi:hypothetical protein
VHELATCPDMQPYLRLIMAGLQDRDTGPLSFCSLKTELEPGYRPLSVGDNYLYQLG